MYTGAQPSHLVVNDHPPGIIEEVPATVPVVQAPVVNTNTPDNIEEVPATVPVVQAPNVNGNPPDNIGEVPAVAPVVQPTVDPVKTKSDSNKDAILKKIEILESDSDVDALSKSIKILKKLLAEETEKKEYWEKRYHEAVAKKDKFKKLFNLRNLQIKRLKDKEITKAEKLKIVKEILAESNFTEAQCGISILIFIKIPNNQFKSIFIEIQQLVKSRGPILRVTSSEKLLRLC